MKEYWQTVVRTAVKAACGYFVAKGLVDESQTEAVTGAIVLLVSVIWGICEKQKLKKAADTKAVVHESTHETTVTKSQLP